LSAWISNLPEKEKNDILLRLIKGHDPHPGAELVQRYRQSDYDSAVQLLVDLRDLSKRGNNDRLFQEKLRGLLEKHRQKPSFVRRLNEAGLGGQTGNS